VGTSPGGLVTVFVDSTLGRPGLQNAQDLVDDADRVVAANDAIFGTKGGPVSVMIFALNGATDGTGGADHIGCDYATGAAIEVCASFGNPARVSALFEAILSECSMGGNLCGISTGEALSRWCAAVISNHALSDFATAPTWAQDGMPDFVNQTDPTDQGADSTGCGMAFLSWLMSQGQGLDQIAPALVSLGDSGTLAQLYAHLTGDTASQAWPAFVTAVQALPGGVTDDDPFGGASQPAHLAFLPPWTVAVAGKVFSVIPADIKSSPGWNDLVDREDEKEWLKLYLTKGRNCQLVGPAGIGKSALLSVVPQLMQEIGQRFKFALINLRDPSSRTVHGLLNSISSAWGVSPSPGRLRDLKRPISTWRTEGIRAVLCLDGFDAITATEGDFTLDFFIDIQEISQQGAIILTTSRLPLNQLLAAYLPTTPFFNRFAILHLGPLSPEAVFRYVELHQVPGLSFTQSEKERILAVSKGYPALVQFASSLVSAAKESGTNLDVVLAAAADAAKYVLPRAS
jgi:hypothetical protein